MAVPHTLRIEEINRLQLARYRRFQIPSCHAAVCHTLREVVYDFQLGCLQVIVLPLHSLHLKLASSLVNPSNRLRNTSERVSRRKIAEYVFCLPIIPSLSGSCPLRRGHISTTSPSPNNNRPPYGTTRLGLPSQLFLLHEPRERRCQPFPCLPYIFVHLHSPPNHVCHKPRH